MLRIGEGNINVKGSGQECPLHACKTSVKIKIKIKGKRTSAVVSTWAFPQA
jgi:hypothetical protein